VTADAGVMSGSVALAEVPLARASSNPAVRICHSWISALRWIGAYEHTATSLIQASTHWTNKTASSSKTA
jgi:hypothetical protein